MFLNIQLVYFRIFVKFFVVVIEYLKKTDSQTHLSRMDNEGGFKNWFFALAAEPNKRIIGRKLILINFFTKLHLNYHTLPVTPFQDLLNCTL